MKKNLFLSLLFSVFLCLCFSSLQAQFFSEAPVTISETGKRLSNMIYVKFKPRDLVEIPDGSKEVNGNFVSTKFPDIRKSISDFCERWQLDLSDLRISKAIPDAKDADTLFTDVRTGEVRKLPNLARVYVLRSRNKLI